MIKKSVIIVLIAALLSALLAGQSFGGDADGTDAPLPERDLSNQIVSDFYLFTGVWRGEGDMTVNISRILENNFMQLSASSEELRSVELPADAYELEDSSDIILTLKESYLKERKNGHNAFEMYFKGKNVYSSVIFTYFVLKDKTVGEYSFRARPNAYGNYRVVLSGIPATVPALLESVTLDGEPIDRNSISVYNPFNIVVVAIGREQLPEDTKPHTYKLTFENLDSVTITVEPVTDENGIQSYYDGDSVEPYYVFDPSRLGDTTAEGYPKEGIGFDGENRVFVEGWMPGDVNFDGKITAADARLALRSSAKLWTPFFIEQFHSADIDGDLKINAADARAILRASARLVILPLIGRDSVSPLDDPVWTDAYCGYYSSDDDLIYTDSLNHAKPWYHREFGDLPRLPLYKFDSAQALYSFKTKFSEGFQSYGEPWHNGPTFITKMGKYDDEWFEDNTLLLVYVEASSGSYRYGLNHLTADSDKLVLYIRQTNDPGVHTCDMSGWFVLVELPKTVAKQFAEFDAMMS